VAYCFVTLLVIGAWLRPVPCTAAPKPDASVVVTLPSPEPSGVPVNDQIWLRFYLAHAEAGQKAPAVVLLHPLGDARLKTVKRFARYLAARGIGAAVMILPYHTLRSPPGEQPLDRYASQDVGVAVQAARQAAADVSAVVTWLQQQPTVDPRRIGVVGISLGALAAHLAMGQDERLTAGVAILGGADLVDLRRHSLVFKLRNDYTRKYPDPADVERLRSVDPLQYADRNRPRRVFMIQAARDLLVPPRDARELWEALGRPPIRWVDTNHFGLGLTPGSVMKASWEYLHAVWSDPAAGSGPRPAVDAITLKLGMVFGLDAIVEPALQWQAISFATRPDHMSLLHTDLGWSGRGFFVGLAATLNAFMDIGVAHRFNGSTVRPYASIHVVF
jgi:dienelactone hydrolase